MRFVCVTLCVFAACKKTEKAGANGTLSVQITSDIALNTVNIIVYSPDGLSKNIQAVNVAKYNLLKAPGVTEDIDASTQSGSITGGKVMLVGVGYDASGKEQATGSVQATFSSGAFVTAALALQHDVVDADEDGVPAGQDCNDDNSKISPFMNELCDGLDNNCNDSVDEGCGCTAGATRYCNDTRVSTAADNTPLALGLLGACTPGTQTCTGGVWGDCIGATVASEETCDDGIDNDCNGSIDEGCACSNGTQRYCNNTQVTLVGQSAAVLGLKGACTAGTQACNNSVWSTCLGAVTPAEEVCDGIDNDCDGVYDNGFDSDGDGFTTCGTKHQNCSTAYPQTDPGPLVGGLDASEVDCDDADVAIHPCQPNSCAGNPLLDANCSDSINQCSQTEECSAAGYYYGWVPAQGSSEQGSPVCYYVSGEFTSQCNSDNYTCSSDAATYCAAQMGKGTAVPASVFSRTKCEDVQGCSGIVPPGNKGTYFTGTDPYGDCGASYNCGSDFLNWQYNSSTTKWDCYQDVGFQNAVCNGGSGCENAVQTCARTATLENSTSISAPCNAPDLNTCKGATAPIVTLNKVDGSEDPAQRCPDSNKCAQRVQTVWTAGATEICTIYKGEPSDGQLQCVSGACGDATNAGCSQAPTKTVSCNNNCDVPATCSAVGNNTTGAYFCYNANTGGTNVGGATGGGTTTACGSGTTCFDSGNKDGTGATCQACLVDYACGTTCKNCPSAKHCMETASQTTACKATDDASACDCY